MQIKYDAKSFWAGITAGLQLHGVGAYGVMPGFDPDGDLILRPITQGVPAIRFGADRAFLICPMIDTIDEPGIFPPHELWELPDELVQEIGAVAFGLDIPFEIAALNELLTIGEVITAYSVCEEINPLEYDDTIVTINSAGAFTVPAMTRTYTSTRQPIDIGTMQELNVTTEEFAEVTDQEVST